MTRTHRRCIMALLLFIILVGILLDLLAWSFFVYFCFYGTGLSIFTSSSFRTH